MGEEDGFTDRGLSGSRVVVKSVLSDPARAHTRTAAVGGY